MSNNDGYSGMKLGGTTPPRSRSPKYRTSGAVAADGVTTVTMKVVKATTRRAGQTTHRRAQARGEAAHARRHPADRGRVLAARPVRCRICVAAGVGDP